MAKNKPTSFYPPDKVKKMPSLSYGEELAHLQMSLEEEAKSNCQVIMHAEGQEGSEFATASERDRMVCWLQMLTQDLQFNNDIFYRSSSLLDTFLSTVKVRHRYVHCVSAASFFIAAKLEESTESVITLLDTLVDKYGCECTKKDIQKMELIIMQKLEYQLTRPTIQDFIKTFHSLAIKSHLFQLPSYLMFNTHLIHLYQCAQHIVCNHKLMKYRPSMLALAVLGCDLKLLDCDWLSTILSLQTLAQVRGGELSVCYEAVAAEYPQIVRKYPLPSSPTPPPKPPRQKWRHIVLGVPDDYDEDDDEDEEKEEIQKEKRKSRRKHKRHYRPPLSRTINVAII